MYRRDEMGWVFEEGTRVMRETGEESRRTLQAVSEQVVEQVRQPRPEIPPPVVEMPRQIQEAPIPTLRGQGNQPHPNIQQQNFFMGEGQRQHEPMEAAAPVADHGHQHQHRYVPPGRKGNVGPHHQPYPRDFFQPQVPPAQPVQHALRPLVRPASRKPYLDIIDHENPFPRGFKVPEFTLFSGEVGQFTIEHIGRFTIQCGEASGDDNLKLKLFPSSLTGTALTWYLGLPQNSVYSWRQMEDLFHTQFYRCEPEVSMADLSRLAQKPGESSEAFLVRFRRARLKCRVALPEQEFVKLAQNGLDIELRKKFEGMKFQDFYELSYKVARYENLLKEDVQKKAASHGTYYSDPNFDLDMAEVVIDKPVVCLDLVRPTHQPETSMRRYVDKAKETMGVDADPFPAVSVGVNVADLRSVTRNRSLPYAQRNLAAEDLRWVLEAQRSRHSRSVRSNKQRLRGQGRITMTRNFSPKGAIRYSTGTRSPRMVKPPLKSPSRRQQQQMEVKGSSSRKPHQPIKRNMVWVRKEKKEAVTQTLLKGDDQSPASPKVASVIVSPDGVLKTTFEAQEQSGNHGAESKEDGIIHFGEFSVNLSCLVLTLPLLRMMKRRADKIVFEKPEEKMARHIRPLYINAHIDGIPISHVLVDNGAAVNVLPTCMLYKIGKSLDHLVHTEVTISDFTRGVNRSRGVLLVELTVGNRTLMSAFFVVDTVATYNALLGRDWIHSSWCVPSSLHQKLIFWNGGKAEVVSADDKSFSANTHLVEARYYEEDIGTIQFFGMDRHGKPIGITGCSRPLLSKRVVEEEREKAVLEITKKLAAYFAEKAVQVDRFEIVHEGEEADRGDEITLEELDLASAKLDDLKAEVQDLLEEINLGSESEPKVTFISGSLEPQTRDQIVRLLHEFKDCFAWDYSEIPGLDRKLMEHKLPIVEGFRPYKQPPRRMSAEVTLKVKEEIERLVKAGFIWTCRYADWLSNVVPVLKKNGKLKVCVDFQNLNLATPKDEYPMPIADLLVDGVACHKILSFMDGHSGYNQIFIADADVPKTAFQCPGAVGTFEWVVMPFGLKNAGATYQRAMNAIFHDMIGKFMEIYIDDVVVKSHGEADHLVHLRKAFERMRQHGLKMNPLKCAFEVSTGNFLGYLVHERGLEVDKNKARVVIEAKPPQNKKELQRFLGRVNFLRRFISNLAGKTRLFSPLLKLKSEADFKWKEHHQSAFDIIKCTETMSGAEVVVISPSGLKTQMSFQLDFDCTNNQAEYEALIIGLEMLVELKVSMVEFDDVSIRHVSRDQNYEANEMAQIASVSTCSIDVTQTDWRFPIIQYLKDQNSKVSRKTKMQALNYVLIEDVLYRRGHDELLLRCLGPDESFQMLSDVHDWICGPHQGYKSCQIHGPLQRVPASELNSIVKPWPFRGWAIDLIDQGTVFVSHQVEAFAKEMGFRLLNSSPHYAQANGQAEASNKVVINLLEKMVDDNPGRWHELLSETLWAYRTSQRSSTKMTPFALTYGHDAVLPMELTARSLRVVIQHNLQSGEYDEAMMLELEDLEDSRLTALDRLQAQKLKIAKSYNKRVKGKNLAVGDLVWKAILLLGKKDHRFGKWSPNWEGPFRIHEVLRGGAYWLESLDGELHPKKINGIYLKPYYPTVWEARGLESQEAV
ncbi:hypothetical protein SLEP1_g31893 [Rubroshorea leprosula]|uniref:Integrase catalytic domain-containing protein n=1 Tax=Rubroshorea leprosula TaxID=152421 RepID=A0AAV5KBN5_9ROSI|nr:hypothetical protein SLEP1_g31893 [Rubroshorea leprosula]